MSTVGDHIQSVRRLLLGMNRPEYNLLTGSLDDSSGSVTLTYPVGSAARGSYLSVDDEIMYVWAVAAQVCTVMRGALGTLPAAHDDGALVETNARFPQVLIRDESVAEIASWPRSVYAVQGVTLTMGTGDTAVDLAGVTGLIDVLRCYRKPSSLLGDRWPEIGFQIKRDMDVGDFSSGVALFLDRSGSTVEGFDMRVVCSTEFDTSTFTDATDLADDVGLSGSMVDALKYGVAWRLLAGREVKRSFTEAQGEPRNAEEVPPGHPTALAENFRKIRGIRIAEEATRLNGIYGWRMAR